MAYKIRPIRKQESQTVFTPNVLIVHRIDGVGHLVSCVYLENTNDSWYIQRYSTRTRCIANI